MREYLVPPSIEDGDFAIREGFNADDGEGVNSGCGCAHDIGPVTIDIQRIHRNARRVYLDPRLRGNAIFAGIAYTVDILIVIKRSPDIPTSHRD